MDTLYTAPPEGSIVICLDEMGPESAKSIPGKRLVRAPMQGPGAETVRPAGRATPAADYGRRGKGYLFGAFRPATGEAFTTDCNIKI
jgi:hypothetical protein